MTDHAANGYYGLAVEMMRQARIDLQSPYHTRRVRAEEFLRCDWCGELFEALGVDRKHALIFLGLGQPSG